MTDTPKTSLFTPTKSELQHRLEIDRDLTKLALIIRKKAGVSTGTYAPSNVTPDRSFDADSTTLAEIADVLGTLIADLQDAGIIQ